MALITLLDAQLAFGHVALLDHTDFALENNERVGLIGRNGTGKSSLLKILAGLEKADDGKLQIQTGIHAVYVAQEPDLQAEDTIFQTVQSGLAHIIDWIDQYCLGEGDLAQLQSQIESHDGWNWEQRVTETLSKLNLNPDTLVSALSGGMRKRVALARALVSRPDVLLLDEPTNHLDLDAIIWLQDLLTQFSGSCIAISHDRAFLDAISTRIIELDRGLLRSYPGNFAAYQTNKQIQLEQEAIINAKADKLLAQEEIWIRKGVEARRTRSSARIERLQVLRAAHSSRRNAQGSVNLQIDTGEKSGKLVAELEGVSKSYGERCLIKNLDLRIMRGDKIALMGSNGAGKSTLLKIILGELAPDNGTVRQGSKMQIAYFDQMRDALDLNATLADFISPGSEWIEIGEQRKHVKSYLSDFLFSPARANSPVSSLSGGERNRLLLARLFARPTNVLVLDEPTNDLDIDTLELLEDLLMDYSGTVFLVSHDRQFVDHVATSILACESEQNSGQWREYEGNVQDWMTQRARAKTIANNNAATGKPSKEKMLITPPVSYQAAEAKTDSSRKLSYKEQRELDSLPERIAALEAEQHQLQESLSSGDIYTNNPEQAQKNAQRISAIEQELMQCLERWAVLGG